MRWVSMARAGEVLGIPRHRVEYMVQRGYVSNINVGRRVWILEYDLSIAARWGKWLVMKGPITNDQCPITNEERPPTNDDRPPDWDSNVVCKVSNAKCKMEDLIPGEEAAGILGVSMQH